MEFRGIRIVAVLAACALAVAGLLTAITSAQADTGLRVSNGRLTEADGKPLVLRGVNIGHSWFKSYTPQALTDVKSLGANSARIVLSAGNGGGADSAASVSTVITRCKAAKLVCIFEVHDTTGYTGTPASGKSLAQAAAYWVSIASAFKGQENYALINLGNEPWGNSNVSQWTGATKGAIATVRAAGLHNTLVVDGPNWGQDYSGTMKNNAQAVFDSDPDRNTVFSVHMYGVYGKAATITSYIDSFRSRGLPLIIGEFGWTHTDGNVDEATIFSYAKQTGTGWLAWSWCGNNAAVAYLDLKTGGCGGTGLSSWGKQVQAGFADSVEASIYRPGSPAATTSPATASPSTAPATTSPATTSPAATAANGYPYCVPGAYIDPDGDGWGWATGKFSCVVRGSKADPGPRVTTPAPSSPSPTKASNSPTPTKAPSSPTPTKAPSSPTPTKAPTSPAASSPAASSPAASSPASTPTTTTPAPSVSPPAAGSGAPAGSPVQRWGQLRVCGTKICDQTNSPVQLRGVSSMWLNWENSGYAENLDALVWMRDTWGVSVIRAAVGIEPTGAYLTDPAKARGQVEKVINNATAAGVYVIVDFHAHNAQNERPQAQTFFADLAKRYGNRPNVIWETFNEPLQVSWTSVLKPYHEAVVGSIRASDPDNIIVLGTPSWSQNVDQAAASPVAGTNLMYTLHFYSCSHTSGLRNKADAAVKAGLPLFVTEWGATNADGGTDGKVCAGEAQTWVNWMKTNGISWAAWKLDDCSGDSSCILRPGAPVTGRWDTWLNGHGSFVRDSIKAA